MNCAYDPTCMVMYVFRSVTLIATHRHRHRLYAYCITHVIKLQNIKLIMGDFNYININWQSWSTNSENTQSNDNKCIECLRDNFLFQHVNNPTISRGSDTPHLIDLVITNNEKMVTDIEHMSPFGKSDHSILSLKLNCYSKINTYSKTKIYYDKADYDKQHTEQSRGYK